MLDSAGVEASSTRAPVSRLAVASLAFGALAWLSAYIFPIAVIWIEKTPLPVPEVIGSLLPGVAPVLAVSFGHVALVRLRGPSVRGRSLAVAGLVLGYVGLLQLAAFELVFWLIVWIGPIAY